MVFSLAEVDVDNGEEVVAAQAVRTSMLPNKGRRNAREGVAVLAYAISVQSGA